MVFGSRVASRRFVRDSMWGLGFGLGLLGFAVVRGYWLGGSGVRGSHGVLARLSGRVK